MSWTSPEVTQLGNTTREWTLTGSLLSTHDAIVAKPTAGVGSGVRINSITVFLNPTRYVFSITIVGAGAMAFCVAGEQMD
jgi:hypothetical protein